MTVTGETGKQHCYLLTAIVGISEFHVLILISQRLYSRSCGCSKCHSNGPCDWLPVPSLWGGRRFVTCGSRPYLSCVIIVCQERKGWDLNVFVKVIHYLHHTKTCVSLEGRVVNESWRNVGCCLGGLEKANRLNSWFLVRRNRDIESTGRWDVLEESLRIPGTEGALPWE